MLKLFGNELRKYREEKGVSQRKLAKKLNISNNYLSMIEKSVKVPSDTFVNDIGLKLFLDREQRERLIYLKNTCLSSFKINLNDSANYNKRKFIHELGKVINQLSDEQIEKMKKIIEE